MKLAALQKYGGISLVIGAALLAAYAVCFTLLIPVHVVRRDVTLAVSSPHWAWIAALAFAGVILLMFGFMAVYSRIYGSAGPAGLLGFILVETAYLLQACKVSWEIFLWPVIAASPGAAPLLRDFIIQHSPLVGIFKSAASLTIPLGVILFSSALMRSKEFPRIAGLFVLAGAVLYGFGPYLSVTAAITGILVFAAGCFVLSAGMIKERTVS